MTALRQASSLRTWFSAANRPAQRVARISSGIVILVGCLVLVGWKLDIAVLKSVLPGLVTMKANTALGFILTGVSLRLRSSSRSRAFATRLASGCAIAVSTIGLLTLCQYLFGWDLGIDRFLFQDTPLSPATPYPGRMGDNTALNFVLIGLALWLTGRKIRYSTAIAQAATICVIAIALLALVGYAYQVEVFHQFILYSASMAVHTALSFLVVASGTLALRPERGLLKPLTQPLIGSLTAQRLIPLAITVPLILGWVVLQGLRNNLYNEAFSLALLVIGLVGVLVAVIWKNADNLNQTDLDRKRSDDRLRSSQERLKLALEGAGQGIWDWDLTTEVLTWDENCKRIFGLPPSFPVTYEWHLDALYPDDRQRVRDAAAIALRNRTSFDEEYRTFHPDGTMRWILAKGQGYYDAAGNAYRMSGTVLDVSDRKQAEQALRENEQRFVALAQASPVTIFQFNTNNECTYVNPRWSEMTGQPAAVALGMGWVDTLHPDDRDRLAQEWLQWVENVQQRGLYQNEGRVLRPDGSICWLYIQALPMIDSDSIRGYIGTLTDITDRKQTEIVLQQQTKELTQLNRLKDEFLAALSHELRTPLNPILGWTRMMQAQRLTPAKTAEALEIIDRNVRQQIRLVDDLLDISQAVQGKLKLELRSIDLVTPLQNAINTVQSAAQAKAITLELRGLASLPLIADSDRLQQVFWNLLSNAIKFTPEGGRVEVDLCATGETNRYARVRVTDTGVGIAPEFLPHVFERFRQADGSSTRNYGGLGLGLSIMRHLVELHGGNVTANSLGVGHGATFTIKLPIRVEGGTSLDTFISQ
jgi:PAS domain S-box-containing protein